MKFEPDALQASLVSLPVEHGVAFAASCCERLLPNYSVFAQREAWGDVQALVLGLNDVWASLEGRRRAEADFRRNMDRCYGVIPHTEEFTSPLVSAALDAGIAVWETMNMVLDQDRSRAVAAARCAYETVHMYLQIRDSLKPGEAHFDERIHADPLMVNELRKQQSDLDELHMQGSLSLHFLRRLRSASVGRSNIGLS